MIRRHGRLLRMSLAATDGIAAIALFLLVSELRFGDRWPAIWSSIFNEPWTPGILVAVGWVAAVWAQDLYRLRRRWSFAAQILAMLRALIVMTVMTFAALFVFRFDDVSRAFVVLLLPLLAVTSLVLRGFIHGWLGLLRRHGQNTRNLLIVGSGATAVRFAREIEGNRALGLRIVGYVNGHAEEQDMVWPYLGPIESLPDVFHERVIDEVAVCLDLAAWQTIEGIVEQCRTVGKVVRIPLAGAILSLGTAHVESLSGIPVLSISQGPDRQIAMAFKRLIDVAVALIGLVLLVPITLIVALAVGLDDGRPVFFRQERVGLHGRRFNVVKFRTMRRGSEELLPSVQALNQIRGHAFKIAHDPRVTTVGCFLRRTSLDELPQLWNVLLGAMSIVGPRPPLPREVNEYDAWQNRRLSMKPGITGLWQVEARCEPEFDRWVEKDLEYIDRWSLWLDTKIALRTLPAMLRLEGR